MSNVNELKNQISIQNLKEKIEIYDKLVTEQREYINMLKRALEFEKKKNNKNVKKPIKSKKVK